MAVFACVAAVVFGPLSLVPFPAPQAASSVPALESVSPAAPSLRMSWRRDTRPSTSCSKKRSSSRSGSGIWWLLGDEYRVGGVPGKGHLAAGPDRVGLRTEAILLYGGELLPAGSVHHVLDRGAEEACELHAALERIRARGCVGARGDQRELLGAHADAHRVAVDRRAEALVGHVQRRAVVGNELGHAAVAARERAVDQVAIAEE